MTETRKNLVHAAMELFATKGYASTSIADILQAADAGSGSLYHFFPGKQDLLLEVLETYEKGIGEMLLEPAWGDVKDPIEKVFALLGFYRQALVITDCSYGCPIGNLALEIHEPDPAVRKRLQANFSAWTGAVETCFRQAARRLPADIDFRELATFTLVTMEGGVMLSRTSGNLRPFDAAVKQLRNYFDALETSAARSANDHQPEIRQ